MNKNLSTRDLIAYFLSLTLLSSALVNRTHWSAFIFIAVVTLISPPTFSRLKKILPKWLVYTTATILLVIGIKFAPII